MYFVNGINQPLPEQEVQRDDWIMSHSDDFALIKVRYFSSYWSVRPYCSTSTVTLPFEYFVNSGASAT